MYMCLSGRLLRWGFRGEMAWNLHLCGTVILPTMMVRSVVVGEVFPLYQASLLPGLVCLSSAPGQEGGCRRLLCCLYKCIGRRGDASVRAPTAFPIPGVQLQGHGLVALAQGYISLSCSQNEYAHTPLEDLGKHRLLDLTPNIFERGMEFSWWSPRVCISYKFPGDADAEVLKTAL